MKYLSLILLLLTGCANMSSTRLYFKSNESTLMVDMPKELEAKNLKVKFNEKQGTIQITSDSWISRNQGTIQSQAIREKAFLESSSVLIEKATEGAVRGAMKGAIVN